MNTSPLNKTPRNSLGYKTVLTSCAVFGAGLAIALPGVATATAATTAPTAARAIVQPRSAAPVFQPADAHYGATNSASVRRMQRLLIKKGYATKALRKAGATGNYLAATKASVRKLQRSLGFKGSSADGIIGRQSATSLGLRWGNTSTTRPISSISDPTPAPTATTSKQLSATQLKSVLQQAGFREPGIRTAWAIAMRESSGIPSVVGPTNSDGTRDYGLFQINDVHRAYVDFSRILDPVYNATYAYQLSNGGTDFSAWAIGDNGWAGQLKKANKKVWQQLQDAMLAWLVKYPG